MGQTIRTRLLVVFVVLSGFSILSALLINTLYFSKKNEIAQFNDKLNQTYNFYLQHKGVVSDFFWHEPTNSDFFVSGTSSYIEWHSYFVNEITKNLHLLKQLNSDNKFRVEEDILAVEQEFKHYVSSFEEICELLYQRGFKDFGIEGEMRQYVHQLEKITDIDRTLVLSLRRHEKDYIIRHDRQYIDSLLANAGILRNSFNKLKLNEEQREEYRSLLDNYVRNFKSLVLLEEKIGMFNNSALKAELDLHSKNVNDYFHTINTITLKSKNKILSVLKVYYAIFITILLTFSFLFSVVFADRITKPIINLSTQMSDFIMSGFRFRNKIEKPKYNDEVGKLSHNFQILGREIIDHISNLQKKVAERTKAISQQKEMIEKQHNKIQSQIEELQHVNKRLDQQKSLVEEQNQNIISSIKYAQTIQESLLPDTSEISSFFAESFVFFKPKDIVSGDFYWMHKTNSNKLLFAVADCTGHGVPGAFMSFLGYTILNQAVKEKSIQSPAEILDYLDDSLNQTIRKHRNGTMVKDGMDISILEFEPETNLLRYAGAFNPIYIVRNNELIEVKGDKIVIGNSEGSITLGKKGFTNHTIRLKNHDNVYLFTDGYADQFGGGEGKKFKRNYFKRLLKSISNLTTEEQKKIISETFDIWKGNYDQVDDVLVFGFQVNK